MLQSDAAGGTHLLDFEAWRAVLRSNCGRDVEVTAPNACKRFGYSPGARAGEGAVRARTAESALSARDVQFGRPRYNRHGRGPVRAAGLEGKVCPSKFELQRDCLVTKS